MNIVSKVFGTFLVILSIISFISGVKHLGVLLILIIGIMIFIIPYIKNKTLKHVVIFGITLYLISYFVFLLFIFSNIKYENDFGAKNADIIVVLGAGLANDGYSLSLSGEKRANKAIEYLIKYPHLKVALTGGKGLDDNIPESIAFKNYLLENGIAEEKIIIEDKSTSSYENLLFLKDILNKNNIGNSILLITNDFHMSRSILIAKHLGYKVYPLASKSPKTTFFQHSVREELAYIKTFIFDIN